MIAICIISFLSLIFFTFDEVTESIKGLLRLTVSSSIFIISCFYINKNFGITSLFTVGAVVAIFWFLWIFFVYMDSQTKKPKFQQKLDEHEEAL